MSRLEMADLQEKNDIPSIPSPKTSGTSKMWPKSNSSETTKRKRPLMTGSLDDKLNLIHHCCCHRKVPPKNIKYMM